jgi:integrase
MREPKYRPHTLRNFAFVEVDGNRVRLPGTIGSDESRAAYHEICRKIRERAAEPLPPPPTGKQLVTLAELGLRFITHCDEESGGKAGCTAANNKYAAKKLMDFTSIGKAHEFGPKRLKEFQKWLIAQPAINSRSYANVVVGRVQGMFAWAVSEELIEETVYRALLTVQQIQPGKGLREADKRLPVPPADLEATIAHLPKRLAAAVRLQAFTGVRSRSVCLAKPMQFDRSPDIWLWKPRHKGEKYNKELIVPIGPRCQAAIAVLFDGRSDDEYLISPRDRSTNRRYNAHYRSETYGEAISRAIGRANAERAENGLPEVPHWHPHRLRHTIGTLVNDRWGEEGAAAMLGHHANVTKLYTAQRVALASQIAAEIG